MSSVLSVTNNPVQLYSRAQCHQLFPNRNGITFDVVQGLPRLGLASGAAAQSFKAPASLSFFLLYILTFLRSRPIGIEPFSLRTHSHMPLLSLRSPVSLHLINNAYAVSPVQLLEFAIELTSLAKQILLYNVEVRNY